MLNSLLVMKEFIDVPAGLLYSLIGFVFVFIGIGILIGILYLVGAVMKKVNDKTPSASKKKKKGKKAKEEENAVPPAPVAEASEEVPAEVKAAIMAAIMAYYDAEKPQCEFVVKKIKRI